MFVCEVIDVGGHEPPGKAYCAIYNWLTMFHTVAFYNGLGTGKE